MIRCLEQSWVDCTLNTLNYMCNVRCAMCIVHTYKTEKLLIILLQIIHPKTEKQKKRNKNFYGCITIEWVSNEHGAFLNAYIGCSVDNNQHPNAVITSNKIHIEMQCLLSHRLILFCGDEHFSQALRFTLYMYTLHFMLNDIIFLLFSFFTYCFVRFHSIFFFFVCFWGFFFSSLFSLLSAFSTLDLTQIRIMSDNIYMHIAHT